MSLAVPVLTLCDRKEKTWGLGLGHVEDVEARAQSAAVELVLVPHRIVGDIEFMIAVGDVLEIGLGDGDLADSALVLIATHELGRVDHFRVQRVDARHEEERAAVRVLIGEYIGHPTAMHPCHFSDCRSIRQVGHVEYDRAQVRV
jgi:hypothetical protein